MDYYNAILADHQNQSGDQEVREDGKVQTISGTGEAVVSDIYLIDSIGNKIEMVDVGQPVALILLMLRQSLSLSLVLGYGIKDRLGQVVFGTNTDLKISRSVLLLANTR